MCPQLTYEDYCCEESLSVVVDAPLTLESKRKNWQDHHLHAVSHPAEPHDDAQHHLKPPEPDAVDRLGDSEGVIRDHSTHCSSQLYLSSHHAETVHCLHPRLWPYETLMSPHPGHGHPSVSDLGMSCSYQLNIVTMTLFNIKCQISTSCTALTVMVSTKYFLTPLLVTGLTHAWPVDCSAQVSTWHSHCDLLRCSISRNVEQCYDWDVALMY